MSPMSRREFFGTVAGAAIASNGSTRKAPPADDAPEEPKAALIHATDLFRPHADPDDHFDLATAFSLAAQSRLELLAVMIDHPPAGLDADPDVQAVAQLNRLAGLAVPVLTGCSRRLSPAEASLPENRADVDGVMTLLRLMRASSRPVLISVVGCCRDVALAGRLEPKLFAAKCAGVYLNAGSGTRERTKAARLEYNVSLDPASYADIFNLPCPVYWLPCFEVVPGEGEAMASGEFGTYYRFLQKDVLDHLSPRLQNYFAFMFKQGDADRAQQSEAAALRPSWLRTLEGPRDEALLERQGSRFRNMWSTAGFFQMAGLSVTGRGVLVEGPAGPPDHPVYTFDPVRVRCGGDGLTEWSPDPRSRDRFLFHVRDPERYPQAMTAALAALLSTLK